MIKETKKKTSEKAIELSVGSNAPLTKVLIKRKKVKKVKVVDSEESYVNKEPLSKWLNPYVPFKKAIEKELAEKTFFTTAKEEEIVKPTEAIPSEKIDSPPIQEEVKSINPTVQNMNVVEDLRAEEDETSTPLREAINVDVECALAA